MKIRSVYTCPLEVVHDFIKGKWKTIILFQPRNATLPAELCALFAATPPSARSGRRCVPAGQAPHRRRVARSPAKNHIGGFKAARIQRPQRRLIHILKHGKPTAGALGVKACDMGMNVRFHTVTELVLRLGEAHRSGTMEKLIRDLRKLDLLILDEWGYVPVRLSHDSCSDASDSQNRMMIKSGKTA